MTNVTHVAFLVEDLRAAESYYCALFGLAVAYREAPIDGAWHTFRDPNPWGASEGGSPRPAMAALEGEGLMIALEEMSEQRGAGSGQPAGRGARDYHSVGAQLSHIGFAVTSEALAVVRSAVEPLGCEVVQEREGLLVIVDRYGVRWELETGPEVAVTERSNGARHGRWIG